MASDFKSFLHDQALADTRAIAMATNCVASYEKLYECVTQTILPSIMNRNANVAVFDYYLNGAALVGLNMAGESIKKLQSEQPQVLAAYPDVPWNALKRIRDIATHWEQNKHTPEDYRKASERLKKEWQRIEPHLGTFAVPNPLQETSDLFRRVRNGLQWFAAMNELIPAASDGIVPINRNPNIGRASELLGGLPPQHLGMMIIMMFQRNEVNRAVDGFNRTSCFYQKENHIAYQSTALQRLRNVRNHWAHFHDVHQEEANLGKTGLIKLIECSQSMDKLRAHIKPEPPSLDDEPALIAYAATLAQRYERNLMGSKQIDPAKAAMLDETVQWITGTLKENQRWQANAAVFAAAKMVRALPAGQAREALDFLKLQGIAEPDALATAAQGQSPVIQTAMREFAKAMQQCAGISAKRA